MFKKLLNSVRSVFNHCSLAVVVSLLTASTAFAADPVTIDVTAATGIISGQGTQAISSVGQALLALCGVVLVYRWVKASFF